MSWSTSEHIPRSPTGNRTGADIPPLLPENPDEAPFLTDVHCHLADARLIDRIDDVIDRSITAGVKQWITCSTSPADWQRTLDLSCRFEGVIPALGIHPWFINDLPRDWLDRLERLLAAYPEAWVGEAGLDALKHAEGAVASSILREQIRLAIRHGRPFVLHTVRAWPAMLALLRELAPLPPFVLHAYSGGESHIQPFLELGAYFSFAGSITRPSARRVIRALLAVPDNRLLIETDAPDFLPQVFTDRNIPNEPAHLVHVLEAASALRQVRPDHLARQIQHNIRSLLHAPVPGRPA